MNIGARMLKTGISIFLSMLICEFFKFTSPSYAAIAAFLAIQPTVYQSWKYLYEQLQGNVVGAICGAICLYTFGNSPFIIGLVVVLLLAINYHLGVSNVSLSVLTALAILEGTQADIFHASLIKIASIIVGILSAVIINAFFLPPKYEEKLFSHIRTSSEHLSVLLRSIVIGDLEIDAYKKEKEIAEKNIQEANELFSLHKNEFNSKIKRKRFSDAKKIIIFRQMIYLLNKEFQVIHSFERDKQAIHTLGDSVKKHIQKHLYDLTSQEERTYMKFDGKIRLSYSNVLENEIINQNNQLVSDLISLYNQSENKDKYSFLLSIVTSLIELSKDLERFDKLVEQYKKHLKS